MKKMWKKRLDDEAVSPVIAVILMVAITVVLAAVLYVTVQQMAETNTSITPKGSVTVRGSSSAPWNYTVSLVEISDDVAYDDFFISIVTDNGTATIGDTNDGIGAVTWVGNVATGVIAASPDMGWVYTSAATTPLDSTTLSSGDSLKLVMLGQSGPNGQDVWDGSEIKYSHIGTNGLIVTAEVN